MKYKLSKLTLVVLLALISCACLFLNASYAYVSKIKVSKAATITTGNLNANITYKKTDFIISSMSDEEGLKQSDYALVTINKDNVYSVFYNMGLAYAINSLPPNFDNSKLLPMRYIKFALYGQKDGVMEQDPLIGPSSVTDLPIYKYNPDNNYNTVYLMNYDIFNAGEDTATYIMKVWLDENIPAKYEDSYVYLTLDVNQETLISKSIFDLSGVVQDQNGNIINNAQIIWQNGKINTTVDENGNYLLDNVFEGTYNLAVNYNDQLYEITIHLQSGKEFKVEQTNLENSKIEINDDLEKYAYTYFTTISKIYKLNNIDDQDKYNGTYSMPNSFIVTGIDQLSKQELKINLIIENTGNLLLQGD